MNGCMQLGCNVPIDGSQLNGIAVDLELFQELHMNIKRQVGTALAWHVLTRLGAWCSGLAA